MTVMVPFALWSWVPLCILLFAALPPRRAMLTAFLGGWLFLPYAGYEFVGLPDYTRVTAIGYGVLLSMLIFDLSRVLTFRPGWIDLPMIVWCICPYFSSVSNQTGGDFASSLYDGMSLSLDQIFIWAVPYFIGRMYLTDFAALRDAAVAIFIGGLVYVPLCLIEIRLSPQLHRWVYGFHVGDVRSFVQTIRFGGFRPTVFMQHGLAVGMFMTAASLVGVWLWASRSLKHLAGVSMIWLVPLLLITTVLCKSLGALLLLMMGLACLFFVKWMRLRLALIVLMLIAPTYMLTRMVGLWDAEVLVEAATVMFGEHRASSLETRIVNEDLFVAKAMYRPLFGWGGWNRFQVYDSNGEVVTTPDGQWVIALGKYGLVGLVSFTAIFLTPVWYLLRRHATSTWTDAVTGPAAGLTVLVILYLIDCMPNAMTNPVFVLAIGGVTTVLRRFRSLSARPLRRPLAAAESTPNRPTAASGVTATPWSADTTRT